ncbi:large subunit ribosomal protein L25 [Paenibacillus shirakamiensis]|uniref:Large ribosomal subunit protein bL25 n=1 Tax=Paenibacillus shirakamiensis TaxID=1265935 RepID=A0ABS4JBH0_9BACL|nr:50S ribosomal protein L25 [Paenibacillus shirakamiensis]MBP1999059.1 large subunit ribosomal protein L25 [Paenibacillus shirakamiensis]
MSEHNVKLNAEKRNGKSNSSMRQLRQEGRVPGVVYGTEMESVSLHVDAKELAKVARTGRSEFFQLTIAGGESFPALIKDVQQQQGKILHVDFQHVSKNKSIRVNVPLHYNGTAEGTKSGGMLEISENQVEVEGLPDALPAGIDIDVTPFDNGHKLTAAELVLPEGVNLVTPDDTLLASVVIPRAVELPEETEEAESAEASNEAESTKE